MEIIKLVKTDNDRLCKIEKDLKFIIDCLSEIKDIKEKKSFLLEQKKEQEQKQDNLLWLKQKIAIEFITQIDDKFFLINIKDTRESFYKKIDKLIAFMYRNMISIGRLYVNKNGKETVLFVKDLQILRSIIGMGYSNIEFKDYSCRFLNIDYDLDFEHDRNVEKYLDSLFKEI